MTKVTRTQLYSRDGETLGATQLTYTGIQTPSNGSPRLQGQLIPFVRFASLQTLVLGRSKLREVLFPEKAGSVLQLAPCLPLLL